MANSEHRDNIMTDTIRTSAVAGTFYPQKRDELALQVYAYLNEHAKKTDTPPKALIVPHAGYVFSGSTAAAAYKQLQPFKNNYKRIVLVGSAHRTAVTGVVLPSAEYFSTPLGMVKLAKNFIKNIVAAGIAKYDDNAHQYEHSLEVQLPFIQMIFSNVEIIPALMGDIAIEQAVKFLNSVWGDETTLLIISSDLSHYHNAATAQLIDGNTKRKVALNDPAVSNEQACAAIPINALLYLAQVKDLHSMLIDYSHSGEQSGDNDRVVGYLAAVLSANAHPDYQLGSVLLRIARAAISARWSEVPALLFPDYPRLSEPGATFVTLTKNDNLRGCIGSLQAHRTLFDDVQKNAVSSAFKDSRFSPLIQTELEQINIEVSLLSASEPLQFSSEAELLQQLRPDIDGIIFRYRNSASTFLPQVWEQLPTAELFIQHLKQKAGLAANFWSTEVEVSRYTVQKWKESDYGR
ncbi:MAG: AmmeMemoRadiSam system protein B [Bacillota bacterium]